MTSKDLIPVNSLFERVVSILEEARSGVVRSINSAMVTAYWLIGREIVRELQGGDDQAEYGRNLIEKLADELTQEYGRGFSATNLRNFRVFYLAYSQPAAIQHTTCAESEPDLIQHMPCAELAPKFNPQLSWSHYRLLMRVADPAAREFYERETAECGWSYAQLERQIKTAYYDRLLKNNKGLWPAVREKLAGDEASPHECLR